MKAKFLKSILAIVCLFAVMLSGCSLFGSDDNSDIQPEPTVYTIIYYDGDKVQTINVKDGDVYSIATPLPSKKGYDFIGLFDAETGGTQYVSATGVSISPFSDGKNLTLYPQFKPKEYTLSLSYGEATATEVRSLTALYGESCPALPGNLKIANKYYMLFQGWYTRENCRGIQVSDENGISEVTMDDEFISLADSNRNITLYAGFKTQTYTVRFFDKDRTTVLKTAEIAHGETISSVKPDKTADGLNIMSWVNAYGTDFSDSPITSDISLYANECKPDEVVYDATVRTGDYKLAGSGKYITNEIVLSKNISDLIDEGYTKLKITVNFNLKEVDDCYQYISLYDSTGVDIYSERVEHGGTKKYTSWKTHSFTCEISLDKLKSSTLYFKCQAENKIFKDFYIGTVTATIVATL